MFKLIALFKGLNGINESAGEFWDLVLMSSNETGQQVFCGSAASYSAAKTLATAIFKASITWDDTNHVTAAFTS